MFVVYKISNISTGKYYIGVHKTSNVDDGYFGSGPGIREAVSFLGKEAFKKEILAIFDKEREAFWLEHELIFPALILSGRVYNKMIGGKGGWSYVLKGDHSPQRRGAAAFQAKVRSDPALKARMLKNAGWGALNLRPEFIRKRKEALKDCKPFLGRKHSVESRRRIGEANSVNQSGVKNSRFGTSWIYSLSERKSKSIPRNEIDFWLARGWFKGRKINFKSTCSSVG